jgi:hypothetical protein
MMVTVQELARQMIYLDAGEEVIGLQSHRGDLFAITNRGRLILITVQP